MSREELIRERAHTLWQQEGCPEDRAMIHWERASQEIEAELEKSLRPPREGTNDVPASNMTVHRGPLSKSALPGFDPADGLSTPGVTPSKSKK